MANEISNSDDYIDVRDAIARFEELDEAMSERIVDDEEYEEAKALHELLSDLKGYGGDEQWRGDWYPITLIRDSYFEDYAEELADDIGAIDRRAGWPLTCIDWKQASRELQQDYSSVEFDGVTYWYR